MNAELVLDAKALLGEGAIWHAAQQQLYWADIDRGELHCFDPATGSGQTYSIGQPVSTVVPRRSGGVLLGVQYGFAAYDPPTQRLSMIAAPEEGRPDVRFNDGKCDPAGRFWAGTISLKRERGAASLYCLDTDLSVRRVLDGLTNSNGLIWSLDHRTLYHIDTPTLRVSAFDYDVEAGTIANRRAVVTIPADAGRPDGMTIDAEGMLWVAMFGGGCVTRWDPASGKLLETVSVPARRTTSCAFGGPNLDRLYITTARTGAAPAELDEQPQAGGLFCAVPGVRGVEAAQFAG